MNAPNTERRGLYRIMKNSMIFGSLILCSPRVLSVSSFGKEGGDTGKGDLSVVLKTSLPDFTPPPEEISHFSQPQNPFSSFIQKGGDRTSKDSEALGAEPHPQRSTLRMKKVFGWGHVMAPEARRCSYDNFASRRDDNVKKGHEDQNQPDGAEAGDIKPDPDPEL